MPIIRALDESAANSRGGRLCGQSQARGCAHPAPEGMA